MDDLKFDSQDEQHQFKAGALQLREEAAAPRSLVRDIQSSHGNARLLQLRRAVQQQGVPAAEAPDWIKEGLGLSAGGQPANAAAEAAVEAATPQVSIPTGGQPLPEAVQRRAESTLGVSLEGVSMVTGADSACNPIQAQAFTADEGGGRHTVALSSGVDLNSADGQFTLMHELSHVAQQKQGQADSLQGLGGDDGHRTHLENHADQQAARILADS